MVNWRCQWWIGQTFDSRCDTGSTEKGSNRTRVLFQKVRGYLPCGAPNSTARQEDAHTDEGTVHRTPVLSGTHRRGDPLSLEEKNVTRDVIQGWKVSDHRSTRS